MSDNFLGIAASLVGSVDNEWLLPSTALVEKKARFLVSSGFSLVKSGDLL